ncbi:hypothetical protein N0V86_000358 [Didymella sp. IMI 355093]|nr:hypothetical protein N0V86_000358 [Didymella sp. IMI 355093]
MDVDASSQRVNPLAGKVFHARADLQIESIEDVTEPGASGPSQDSFQSHNDTSTEDVAEKEDAANMQLWWDEAIAKNLNYPEGYAQVSVLIIKWAEDLDELNTGDEVCLNEHAYGTSSLTSNQAQELDTLFRDRFHYHTETIELNLSTKPQLQLNSRVSNFTEKYDGPNNLLIVYYTGHGVFREQDKPQYLQLAATVNPSNVKGIRKDAHLSWNKVENILKSDDVEADCLAILDTCYASNATKSARQSSRKFELLAACAMDQTTAAPGKNSFTRSLIDSLTVLASTHGEKQFSTFNLNQCVCKDARRSDTPSVLWNPLPNDQHIFLAPLTPPETSKHGADKSKQKSNIVRAPRGYLTLRLALRDEKLGQEQIEFLTLGLAKAFENKKLLGIRNMEWLGMKRAPISYFERAGLAMHAVAQWRKFVHRQKAARGEPSTLRGASSLMDVDATPLLAPARKRERDGTEHLPGAKRRTTGASTPPLTPTFDISRSQAEL